MGTVHVYAHRSHAISFHHATIWQVWHSRCRRTGHAPHRQLRVGCKLKVENSSSCFLLKIHQHRSTIHHLNVNQSQVMWIICMTYNNERTRLWQMPFDNKKVAAFYDQSSPWANSSMIHRAYATASQSGNEPLLVASMQCQNCNLLWEVAGFFNSETVTEREVFSDCTWNQCTQSQSSLDQGKCAFPHNYKQTETSQNGNLKIVASLFRRKVFKLVISKGHDVQRKHIQ